MEVRAGPCLCGEPERVVEEGGKQVMVRCPLYTQMRGDDPQTGQERDEWACAIAWLPILLVETAKEVRQGAAATESFRNEVVKRVDQARAGLTSVTRSPASPLLVQEPSDAPPE